MGGVEVEDSFIVSGGYDTPDPVWTYELKGYSNKYISKKLEDHIPVGTVVIFKRDGQVEFLPSLIEPRAKHACASYLNEYGQTVILVTGGVKSSSSSLDSTELMVDFPSWRP